MSAAEIIEQIKALPHDERRQVFDFLEEAQRGGLPAPMRFANDEQVGKSGDAVAEQYSEVFKRLAE